jgi:hypothetical protein
VSPATDDPERPGVYARLAEQAEMEQARRTPPRATRWVGWAICLAIAVAVVLSALEVKPW